MLSLLLIVTVILGFLSGSIWLFAAAIGVLAIKMFPILLVVIAIGGGAVLIFKYHNDRR